MSCIRDVWDAMVSIGAGTLEDLSRESGRAKRRCSEAIVVLVQRQCVARIGKARYAVVPGADPFPRPDSRDGKALAEVLGLVGRPVPETARVVIRFTDEDRPTKAEITAMQRAERRRSRSSKAQGRVVAKQSDESSSGPFTVLND